jgi:hypothetical protein
VAGTSSSTSGRGIFGDASAATGSTFGLFGQAASVSGIGLQGSATAVTGTTTGVRAVSFSPAGTAAVLDNLGGGKLISARTTGFVEKFAVSAGGNVTAAGTVTGADASFSGPVVGTEFTGTSFTGNGSSLTGVDAELLDGLNSTAFSLLGHDHGTTYVLRAGDTMTGSLSLPLNGLAVGTSQLVASNGRVGIGTTTPSLGTLHVAGASGSFGGISGGDAPRVLYVLGGEGGAGEDQGGSGGQISIISGSGGADTNGNGGGGNATISISGGTGGAFGSGGGAGGTITLSPGAGGSGAPAGSNGNVIMVPTSVGRVGVATDTPLDLLHVAGDIRVGTGSTGCVKDADATVLAGTCVSDLRFKTNILAYPAVLAKIAQLNPVTFDWRAEEFPERHFGTKPSFGLIAQDVERIFPDMVAEDDKGFKAVKYHKLPILMLAGMRELKAENDSLKSEIGKLQDQLASMLARLAELEKK